MFEVFRVKHTINPRGKMITCSDRMSYCEIIKNVMNFYFRHGRDRIVYYMTLNQT